MIKIQILKGVFSMSKVSVGIISSVMGGIVFGMMMTMMDSITMIAGMVGSSSVVVGWLVHLMISVIFGAVFGLVLTTKLIPVKNPIVNGTVYGFILWALFPFIMLPVMMGGGPFQFDVYSLMGHLIYGVVLGVTYKQLYKPEASQQQAQIKTGCATTEGAQKADHC